MSSIEKDRRMTDYDNPWKETLDCYFELFLSFFFPRVHSEVDWARGHVSLDKELRKILKEGEMGQREADMLVKVWLRGGQEVWILIHVEIQSQEDPLFPQRMFVYNYRAFDRFNRMVLSLAILGDDRPTWRPDRFSYGIGGCSVEIRFPIVKLLDYANDWAALEANPNPFATVVMAHLKALETRKDPGRRRTWKLELVKRLYEKGHKAEEVRRLFKFIDWIMTLPQELENAFWHDVEKIEEEKRMPFITSVERIGIAKGMEIGLNEGLQKGLQKGIAALLKARFGKASSKVLGKIRKIHEVQTLEELLDAAESATTLEDLHRFLPG
jgi:predicted transposase YdaD